MYKEILVPLDGSKLGECVALCQVFGRSAQGAGTPPACQGSENNGPLFQRFTRVGLLE